MAQALHLAERGLYTTSPNPRVGCVLVREAKMVGEGWHELAGGPHAEAVALRMAGEAARGATAFVTLEPCSHQGRTPPCADALIAAGVTRVVAAVQDPNPQVAGQGLAKLRAAGIEVECGLMEAAARELNVGFFARMTRGTPWLRSKIAMSVDGRTALANGVSRWITGEPARLDVQHWRARSCAIVTGIGTLLADDPQLNVRDINATLQPLRVVLDSKLRIPLTARILNKSLPHTTASSGVEDAGKLLIYTAVADAKKIEALEKAGASVCVLPDGNGKVNLADMLADLARRGCNEILLEAGSVLNGAMLRAGLVDELILYLAPQLLGDAARGMAQLGELTALDQRVDLKWQDVRQVGNDLRLTLKVGNV
jgi:diaminohydroxyphosphoribosylaminopyrimidine deaminase/5-amino-6-(5-phosphoribosylamino)uracil reductase